MAYPVKTQRFRFINTNLQINFIRKTFNNTSFAYLIINTDNE